MKESGRRSQGVGASAAPCAACKLLRRRCSQECVFLPYFPADEPHKFASVHKVFGASNVNKMLQELPEDRREDAVSAMVYEANARVRDPVYGCVGAIASLQQQVDILQSQLALAQAQVVQMRMSSQPSPSVINSNNNMASNNYSCSPDHHHQILPPTTSSSMHRQFEAMSSIFTEKDTAMVEDQVNIEESLWSYYY